MLCAVIFWIIRNILFNYKYKVANGLVSYLVHGISRIHWNVLVIALLNDHVKFTL